MPLKLSINSYHKLTPGIVSTYTLDEGRRLSIGRAADNDWTLQDPDLVISGHHCHIDAQGGQYLLTDTSTNGVFIASERVGRGLSRALRHGDLITIGDYEICVDIEPLGGFGAPPAVGAGLANDSLIPPGADPSDPFGLFGPTPGGGSGAASSPLPSPGTPAFADTPFTAGPAQLLPDDFGLFDLPPAAPQQAAAIADHVPSEQQAFVPPAAAIPDDWDALFAPAAAKPDAADTPAKPDAVDAQPAPPAAAASQPAAAEAESAPSSTVTTAAAAPPADWDALFATPPTPAEADEPPSPPVPPAASSSGADKPPPTGIALPVPSAPPSGDGSHTAPPSPPPPPPRPVSQTWHSGPLTPAAEHAAPAVSIVPPTPPARATADGLHAFLDGAGLAHLRLDGADGESMLREIGASYRLMVQGLIDVLRARASLKSEFRMSQTMIRPVENNPLKFAPNVEEAMALLLRPQGTTYLGPEKAVGEAFDDLRAHQLAVVAGLQAALGQMLRRFDPAALEARFGGGGGLFSGNRKARCWEQFQALYQEIAHEAEDDFQELFGREFTRAYEEQIARLRR